MNGFLGDKRKLIFITSILLIAGFLATTLASYYVSKLTIRRTITDNELPITSDNIYSEIQKDLIRPIIISSLISRDTFLRDWVLSGEKDVGRITKYLKEIKDHYGMFTSFFISEKTRSYYHGGGILKKVAENEDRDVWYFRVQKMKEPYEINVDIDMANRDALTIFINYRVFDYGGDYIGAAGVGLTVDAVSRLIADYQKRYKRVIYFINNEGDIMISGSGAHKTGANLKNIDGIKSIAEGILKNGGNTYQYKYKNKNILLNTRYINELKWHLIVEKTEDEAIAGIRYTLLINLLICLGISVFILVIITFTINRYQTRIENLATHDSLTGLGNRRAYDILMKQAISDRGRTNEPLSVILTDIDNFKLINDTYGHKTGDMVLTGISDALRSAVREADIICRWGGEEFLIVLKKCSRENAFDKAENLRKILERQKFLIEDKNLTLTVSMGVGQYSKGETEEDFLTRIDRALYKAKTDGKNRVCNA